MHNHRADTDHTTRAIHATTALVLVLAGIIALLWATSAASASDQTSSQATPVPAAARPTPAVAQVTVVDHTRGLWHGLARAVKGWNRSPLVHIVMADQCKRGTYCVIVDAYDHGDASWMGLTTSLTDHLAHSQYNLHFAGDVRNQTATACHELGHALGIAHPNGGDGGHTHGCIAGSSNELVTPTASHADLAKLDAIRAGDGTQGWGALWVATR